MTIEEKRVNFKIFAGDSTISDDVATLYLSMAENEILNARYPYERPANAVVEARYELKQCRLAAAMYLKQQAGIEADMTSHTEQIGNTSFTDTFADFAASGKSPWVAYLLDIIPVAKVVG